MCDYKAMCENNRERKSFILFISTSIYYMSHVCLNNQKSVHTKYTSPIAKQHRT